MDALTLDRTDEPRKWPPRQPPGEKALAWCRENIKGFAVDERQVRAAIDHAETVKSAVSGGVEAS